MNRNEAQAHCILVWNLLPEVTVNTGLRALQQHPGLDLCGLLVKFNKLNSSQVDQVRRAVDRHMGKQLSRPVSLPEHGELSSEQARVLRRIARTNDLIKTFKVEAPEGKRSSSRVVVERSTKPFKQPEDLMNSRGLQDGLKTLRVDVSGEGELSETQNEDAVLGMSTRRRDRSERCIGLKFSRFKIMTEIASGAMGVILKAWHIPSKKTVALKVLFEGETDRTVFARFRREAKVLSRLRHPNIVKIIEHGYENNDPYLAMEYIVGKSLKELVGAELGKTGAPPSVNWAVETLLPVAEALYFCHENGAIHRDVKPLNILVEGSGRAVLVDFGLVKRDARVLTTSVHASLSRKGEILGTPAFMSPEQLDAKGSQGEITEKSDVWGLGATLFYCLTGQTPYIEESAMATYMALLTKEPRRPSEINGELPVWVDRLCADMLQRNFEQRPNMLEVIERLRDRR